MTRRLAIPIHDEHGRLVACCGRSVVAELPRYEFPAGFRKSAVLFNYHRAQARTGRRVIVVEGFFDCMRVHQAGFSSVVAPMGDAAGQAGTCDAAARLARRCSARQVILPTGKQPDQMSDEEIRRALRGEM